MNKAQLLSTVAATLLLTVAGSCELMLAITTTSERTGHWTKMRRFLAQFSGLES